MGGLAERIDLFEFAIFDFGCRSLDGRRLRQDGPGGMKALDNTVIKESIGHLGGNS